MSSSVEERDAADRCGGSRRGGSSASVTCEHASAGASENRVESGRVESSRTEPSRAEPSRAMETGESSETCFVKKHRLSVLREYLRSRYKRALHAACRGGNGLLTRFCGAVPTERRM